jgi:hypothetical protein
MFGGREVGRRLRMRKFSMPYAVENMPMVEETERRGSALAALALITSLPRSAKAHAHEKTVL